MARRVSRHDPLLEKRSEAEAFGRRVVAATLAHLHGPARRRAFSGATMGDLDRLFAGRLPETGRPPATVLRDCRDRIFPHSMQTSHPRLFGLFNPAPVPVAAFAELIAAFLNQSVDAWKAGPAATHLEMRLIRWINDLIGFGPRAFGVFTSGGGIANTIALKMARDGVVGSGGRRTGLPGRLAGRLRVYASDQAHFSIVRSLDLLGLGERALRPVSSDRARRMRPEALQRAIRVDRRRGLVPMAVVATAGTTNTGSVDPLRPIGRIARDEGIACHVDAAYGGALLFSARYRDRLDGLHLADSVTIDPHKWLFQPFSIGGLFVRDGRALGRSFRIEPGYLRKDLEPEPERLDFYHYSLEGSRPFRGLKLWFTLQSLGRRGLGELVDRTMDVAQHLARRAAADPALELLGTPVDLASVCLRFLPRWARLLTPGQRRRPATLRRLNRTQNAIQHAIEAGGEAWFPIINLDGAVYMRFGVFNYRTTRRDVDFVLRRITRIGNGLAP